MNTTNPTPPHDPFATKESKHAFFQRLEKLLHDCGPGCSKHDKARVAIAASIDEGILSGKRLVGILATVGFDRQHAGRVLHEFCGPDPYQHDWWTDAKGNYCLHSNPVQAAAAKIVV